MTKIQEILVALSVLEDKISLRFYNLRGLIMSYLKNSITLFVIFLLSTPTNGHGPSRQKVSESIEINASSDEVWKIVSDFNNFNWNKSVENKCELK